ncbi:MAG: hypothetical protein DRQ51_05150 [Gammaproteobacteria bacterium]|nr:MAG: hypothetical protein DRQ51_05150 [Gammaproteobacteria bacterium]
MLRQKIVSKRKKDGIFYTPEYITKYIVDNTIGTLCQNKKQQLKITNIIKPKNHKKLNLQEIQTKENLTEYKNWLLNLKILDPACGSGAFLNQALEFLVTEHKTLQEDFLLFRDIFNQHDINKSILENNLYGVDINESATEIAKLSLWLKTADNRRPLTKLANKIKCGNSLIDDKTITANAFNWQAEFPEIFKQKKKQVWHITTATHNSRYSQRMVDYKVKTGKPIYFTQKEEVVICKTIYDITQKDKLNILAFNVCGDHLHMLLVCEEEEVSKIVGKIKAMTSKICNKTMGRTTNTTELTRGHVPLSKEKNKSTVELTRGHVPLSKEKNKSTVELTRGHVPLSKPYVAMWTQKFGKKLIQTEEQITNTAEYIQNNRIKHELPKNIKLEKIIARFIIKYEQAFVPEYNGGFDIVIGNPPYVRQELLQKTDKQYFVNNFQVGNGTADLYVYFYEVGISVLKDDGLLGFITPNKFYKTKYGKELRQFTSKHKILKLIDFFELNVFEDASTDSQIMLLCKTKQNDEFYYSPIKQIDDFINNKYQKILVNQNDLNPDIWVFNTKDELNILNKMKNNSITLQEYSKNGIEYGIKTGLNEAFIIDKTTRDELIKKDIKSAELLKPYLSGTEINKWTVDFNNKFIITTFPSKQIDIEKYIGIKNYLENFGKKRLEQSGKTGSRKKTSNKWFETQDSISYHNQFENPKILYIHTAVEHKFYYDEDGYYINNSSYFISNADKFLSVWLNSNIFKFYKKLNFVAYGDSSTKGRAKLDYNKMVNVPMPTITQQQKEPFIQKADTMLELNKKLSSVKQKFIKDLELEKVPKKLKNFENLNFDEFINEYARAHKIKFNSKLEQRKLADQWQELFEQDKKTTCELQEQINQTDQEIDQMVYKLYKLTDDEIKTIEN